MNVFLSRLAAALLLPAAFASSGAQAPPLGAQEPDFSPPGGGTLNPMAVSRSGLRLQPMVAPRAGWSHELSIDYGSAAEWEESSRGGKYVLDAELLRVNLHLRRDISPKRFVQFSLDANGVFDGFCDAAFDWYHDLVGVDFRGREKRPRNQFGYSLLVPQGVNLSRERPDYYLGDLHLGYGLRHGGAQQTVVTVTLPTATAPEGYAKDVWSVAAMHTFRLRLPGRILFEGSVGAGYTPSVGETASIQRQVFHAASASATVPAIGGAFYGSLFSHSALYAGTTLPELESQSLIGDIGFMRRIASGHMWRVGITEDFGPTDAGIDLTLRMGVAW